MTILEYTTELQKQYSTGVAREHTYRPALQNLLATMLPHLTVSNEPARQACGAPDYILQRKETNTPVAFIEAKDLNDSDLGGRSRNKEQFDRYKHSLDNIIFTDYLDFQLYEKGEFVEGIRIAEMKGDRIVAQHDKFEKFEHLISHFGKAKPQKITSSSKLAEIMAGKAKLLANVIEMAVNSASKGSLMDEMESIKELLIHDITPAKFADVYAQTISYGMFAARLHDNSPDTFSREEAAKLIPKTNPFLRKFFQYVAGYDLDERISWIVDDLAESFRVTDIEAVMSGFAKKTGYADPMIHFYEDFLTAYNPVLRTELGAWYTPKEVVNFIVRGVDEILQREFNLPMGLADISKTKIKVANQKVKKKEADYYELDVHRIQILDPATGTGTFLAETVSQIYEKFRGQGGMWQGYVNDHLVPRINGFEYMMAPYTIAHLKLELLLRDTGYVNNNNSRFRIFLTNSLDKTKVEDQNKLPFFNWLSQEADEANRIKNLTPVMVVMGNPPYSGISSNKGKWISQMIDNYKYVDGVHFNERKHWLNDDYVKFMRLGQYFVDKNAEGVLAYINNHSFIDNPTFRGMRWNLMKSFDKIYIIDLHGNSMKKEVCPDGSKDENVFDIQQGVSINIFVKTGKKPAGELAEVYHYDLWGKREDKYNYLLAHGLSNVPFVKVEPTAPFFFMMPKNEDNRAEYEQGFRIDELMKVNVTGIVTARDGLVIDINGQRLIERISDFADINKSDYEIRDKYFGNRKEGKYLAGDSRGWKLAEVRKIVSSFNHENIVIPIDYRPFDTRYIYYHPKMVDWGREKQMRHFLAGENLGLVIGRQGQVVGSMPWNVVFISKCITDFNLYYRGGGVSFPLYQYPEQVDLLGGGRRPNLNMETVAKFADSVGLEFESEKSGETDKFAPIDLLDYIYAVLHYPSYRETYKEFLKTDFPRIPYPAGESAEERAENFRRLASLGRELRQLHLMEHPALKGMMTDYLFLGNGNNTVEKLRWELSEEGNTQPVAPVAVGRVWINPNQYFDRVPAVAWNFYIGGYQPAQKWLKDRNGMTLSFDDIMHYQRIIVALTMTSTIMQKL